MQQRKFLFHPNWNLSTYIKVIKCFNPFFLLSHHDRIVSIESFNWNYPSFFHFIQLYFRIMISRMISKNHWIQLPGSATLFFSSYYFIIIGRTNIAGGEINGRRYFTYFYFLLFVPRIVMRSVISLPGSISLSLDTTISPCSAYENVVSRAIGDIISLPFGEPFRKFPPRESKYS